MWPDLSFSKGVRRQDVLPTPNQPIAPCVCRPMRLAQSPRDQREVGVTPRPRAGESQPWGGPQSWLCHRVPRHGCPDLDVTLWEKEDTPKSQAPGKPAVTLGSELMTGGQTGGQAPPGSPPSWVSPMLPGPLWTAGLLFRHLRSFAGAALVLSGLGGEDARGSPAPPAPRRQPTGSSVASLCGGSSGVPGGPFPAGLCH